MCVRVRAFSGDFLYILLFYLPFFDVNCCGLDIFVGVILMIIEMVVFDHAMNHGCIRINV